MKKLIIILIGLTIGVTVLNLASSDTVEITPDVQALYSENQDFEFDEISIIEMIDQMAGLPSDPDLPKSTLGATDIVLKSTNPRELADLITMGLNIANKNVNKTPRSLFYLGRVAYFLEYHQSVNWIEKSAQNGSKAACAYLGYIHYENGDNEKAKIWLNKSLKYDYTDNGLVMEVLNEISPSRVSANLFDEFNRSDIITALYNEDYSTLRDMDLVASYYVGAVQNTLWESDILFLVSDTNFILELDPSISAKLGLVSSKAKDYGVIGLGKVGEIIGDVLGNNKSQLAEISLISDQATQDARRLALLYENSPETFRRIYHSMSKFSKIALKIDR